MNPLEVNVLVLAYLGDVIYENYIRRYLIDKGINHVNELQEAAIKYVSAKSQKEILLNLINNNILTDDEIKVMKRARNCKVNHHPKNCDIVTYHYSTGFEAIFGYLDLCGKQERIKEIIHYILEV